MKFSLKELKRISKWFDKTSEDLDDLDLKAYDKINRYIKEEEESLDTDPLVFPAKKIKKDNEIYEDECEPEEEFDDKEEYRAYLMNKDKDEED